MKNKYIVTGLGVALLSVGMIGGVWTGVNAIPSLVNKKQITDDKYNEKQIIFNESFDISQLEVNLQHSNVVLRKHDSDKILIERTGAKDISNLRYEKGEGVLKLSEDYKDEPIKEIKNINDIVKGFVDDIFSSSFSEVAVYLPKEVNLSVSTDNGYLTVEDDVVLDSLTYKTNSGSIGLNNSLEFENLNIMSANRVSVAGSELLGIKNAKLEGHDVYIHSEGQEMFLEDLENKIPDVLEIKSSALVGYSGVNIQTSVPVAKNINIQTISDVNLNVPLLEHKFNFDIKTNQGIDFYAMQNNERYYNTPIEKFFNNGGENHYDASTQTEDGHMREYNGLLNDNLKDEPIEYKVNIKASKVMFE